MEGQAMPQARPPFATQRIAVDEYFTDREVEVARVLEAMRGRGRLVLYGERRMGKSWVIARAAERVRGEGGVVLSVDAWTITDLDELNRALMAAVPTAWLVGARLSQLVQALRSLVHVTVDDSGRPTLGLSGSAAPDARPSERLSRILRGLNEVAATHGAPVVVVIDEFQRMEDVEAASGGLLRRIVQETPDLAYVFAGSIVGLVMELLGPGGPFHAIDRLEVKAIDRAHLIPWLEHRLASHGVEVGAEAAATIYELAGPVTEYVMRLARVAHRRASERRAITPALVHAAFDEIVADHTGSFELIWDSLPATKRQVLRAVADGEQKITSKDVLDLYRLNSSSAAAHAIKGLRHDGLLAPGKPFRVSDPFFAAWVRGT
jgi:uncharacterized protein